MLSKITVLVNRRFVGSHTIIERLGTIDIRITRSEH